MNFVIPMAGEGKRFVSEGYDLPKYLITVKNKSLLEWSVDSLPIKMASKIIFIILKSHEERYNVSGFIKKIYQKKANLDFIFLKNATNGQSETVLYAWSKIIKKEKLLIFNIDTNFTSKTLENNLKKNSDGLIGTFNSNLKRFSYAKIINGIVCETAEKKVISKNALSGLYVFSDPYFFFNIAKKSIRLKKTIKNEYYIAPLYNDLIKMKKRIIIDKVKDINILGTPEELRVFASKK